MFGSSSRMVFYSPALYYWLLKYKGLMVSKVTICLELILQDCVLLASPVLLVVKV